MPRKSVHTPRYERLRKLLVEARGAAGLTQVELAARLHRPQSFVSKYERGERRLDVIELLDITGVLGVEPGKLLDRIDTA